MNRAYGDRLSGTPLLGLTAVLVVLGLSGAAALAAPRVDYLVPGYGAAAGGTQVVVVGAGFETGASVTVGGIVATAVTVLDSRTITATTGASTSPQMADVEVTNPDTSSGVRSGGFAYLATAYYVDQAAGDDASSGLSPAEAKRTIQAVLNLYQYASPSDPPIEVRVAEGVYVENLVIYYNQILTGGWSSGFAERSADRYLTVVDGDRRGYVARSYGVGVSPAVDGFTLLNGERTVYGGGGFYSTDDTVTLSNSVLVGNRTGGNGGAFYEFFEDDARTATVRNSVIVGNRAEGIGGGVGVYDYFYSGGPRPFRAGPVLADNVLAGNRASQGGAFANSGLPDNEFGARLTGNRIVDNRASVDGGGIALVSETGNLLEVELTNNLVRGNAAEGWGGGIILTAVGFGGRVQIEGRNNTIALNQATPGGAQLHQSTAIQGSGRLASEIIRGEDPVFLDPVIVIEYSNVEEGYAGTGNFDLDPLFVTGPIGDFYLSQVATGDPGQPADSPSLDAGDPAPGAGDGVLRWVDGSGSTPTVRSRTTRTDELPDTGVIDQGHHGPDLRPPVGLTPMIWRADPAVFSFRGDEWLVIRGEGFHGGTRVRFDGAEATDTILHSAEILVARPGDLDRGAASLEVRNPGPDGIPDTGDDLVATLGGLTAGDTDPPVWTGPPGLQSAEDLNECEPRVGLAWEAAEDLDSPPVVFDVYRTTVDPFFGSVFDPGPDSRVAEGIGETWWVDTGVVTTQTYWYLVQARDFSEDPRRELNNVVEPRVGVRPTVSAGGGNAPPPVGATLLVSEDDSGAVLDAALNLVWTPVYPAVRYHVYRDTDPSEVVAPGNRIGTTEGQHNAAYTDETAPVEPILFYRITSEDGCGNESS